MSRLLVIADDLTGALDSGVQLARKGAKVVVCLDACDAIDCADGADVVVVDSETRHVDAKSAYETVKHIACSFRDAGVGLIYKKTDSGLRGNVGAELQAVLDATGEKRIDFVPAYPKLGRTTLKGVQYVDGVPLAESVFASDPLDPMDASAVADIIHEQSDVTVCSPDDKAPEGVIVHDCATQAGLEQIADTLFAGNDTRLCAGCAGLLEQYQAQDSWDSARKSPVNMPSQLLVLSGSVNAVTSAQLASAEKEGAYRGHLPIDEILSGAWGDEDARAFAREILADSDAADIAIVDTLDESGHASDEMGPETSAAISGAIGLLARQLAGSCDRTVMVIGGDTLRAFVDSIGVKVLEPVAELFPGTVLASYQLGDSRRYLITKSGAFGASDLLRCISHYLHTSPSEN